MEQTVELSQKEKLKKFNEKLQMMMKNKNLDKAKLTVSNPQSQNVPVTKPQQNSQPKPQQTPINKEEDSQQGQEEQNPSKQKTKLIKKDGKKKEKDVTLRKVAGEVWKDKTLEEWPENDYRIFVGNLGNEVTDEILSAVFRNKYNSFQKGKVVIDKRTGKTKGYGFVSFKEPKDFLNALKEMNNKYIGNRPVKITKSNWKDRALDSEKNKYLPSDFKAISQKETNKVCPNFKYVSPF